MAFSVVMRGEHLSGLTAVGFCITVLGVTLYKVVAKGPPAGEMAVVLSCHVISLNATVRLLGCVGASARVTQGKCPT